MDNTYILALQRLELIENHAKRIIEKGSDENTKTWLAEIQDATKEVKSYLQEKKHCLEDKPPLSIYKSGGH